MIYLIHSDFNRCASDLHEDELYDQIRTGYGILVNDKSTNNSNEADLWKYYERNLAYYWAASVGTFMKHKTYDEHTANEIQRYLSDLKSYAVTSSLPDWLDRHLYTKHLLMSHRVYLLRRNYDWYKDRFPKLAEQSLDKYPPGLFWMVTNNDQDKIRSNEQWMNCLGIKKYIR